MSIVLDGSGTSPSDIIVKTSTGRDSIMIGQYTISGEDFAAVVHYFLTNADLAPNDPRIGLVQQIRKLRQIEGWSGPSRKRFGFSTRKRPD